MEVQMFLYLYLWGACDPDDMYELDRSEAWMLVLICVQCLVIYEKTSARS